MEPKGTSIININYLHGFTEGSCGYCHNPKGSITCGFAADHLSLSDYQNLMDRGWRRCGDYFYKPDVPRCCCKWYTIRLDTTKYQMRQSHKKVMKKWNRFLAGEDVHLKNNDPKSENGKTNGEEKSHKDQEFVGQVKAQAKNATTQNENNLSGEETLLNQALRDFVDFLKTNRKRLSSLLSWTEEEIFQVSERTEKELKLLKGNAKKYGSFNTNLLLLLFADNRVRLGQGGVKNVSDFVGKIKDLAVEGLSPLVGSMQVNVQENGYIGFGTQAASAGTIHKTMEEEVKAGEQKKSKKNNGEGKMNVEESKGDDQLEHHKHKEIVRKDLTAKVVEEEIPGEKARKFEIRFERAKFEKESFEMYQRYCKHIHEKEKEDAEGYRKFLCMQSLEVDRMESGGKVLQLGCYHMKYFVDGKMIAVGVVDIFPFCLSSVYFFYDPEYKNLSLGVVGAIKEIEYVQEMQKFFPEFKYYYLGYYIQDCQKMVYKGDYEPAELLCPTTYTWVALDAEMRKKVEKKESRLSGKDAKLIEDMDFSGANMEKFVKDKIKLNINGPIKLIQLNKQYQQYFLNAFKDIVPSIGRNLSNSFVFGSTK